MTPAPLALIDTNVLVYAHDAADHTKQLRALSVLEGLAVNGGGALSTQCLVEFANAVTRRIAAGLSFRNAGALVEWYANAYAVFPVTARAIADACRVVAAFPFSLWDALIWAVARANRIPIILTEDLQDREQIEGIRYLNPFDPGFDLAQLDA